MKFTGAAADKYLDSRSEVYPLTIVFSADDVRARRVVQDKMKRVLGDNASEDMRLHHIDAKTLSSDPAMLADLIKTKSFFPGPVGVAIFGATDGMSKLLETELENWQDGDALIFVQAGNLTKNSKIRKSFEGHKSAVVIGLYQEPLSRDAIILACKEAGLGLESDAQSLLVDYAKELDRYSLENLCNRLAIYQGDAPPLSAEELLTLLPASYAQAVDEIIYQLLSGQNAALLKNLKIAPTQGISIHQILAFASLQVKNLVQVRASSDVQGAMSKMRPPLFGERRTRFQKLLSIWSLANAEAAQNIIFTTENEIRRGKSHLPIESFVERQFMKICHMARGQN